MYKDFIGTGFHNNSVVYLREGEIIAFPLGNMLLTLMDMPLEALTEELRSFVFPADTAEKKKPKVRQQEFLVLFERAYSLLTPYPTIFCDWLIDKIYRRIEMLLSCDPVEKMLNDIKSEAWNGSQMFANFSYYGFIQAVSKLNASDPNAAMLIEHFAERTYVMYSTFTFMREMLGYLIPAFLLRESEGSSAHARYADSACYKEGDFSGIIQNPQLAEIANSIKNLPDECVALIVDIPATKETAAANSQMVYFRRFYDCEYVFLRAFEYMCASRIELCACKNCGKYFTPISKASSFCNRKLPDGSGRTCRDISSQWYAKERRGNGSAYDIFLLYKKRYLTRKMRNPELNPQGRYDDWKREAKKLMKECDSGQISLHHFSEMLAEMDKDMEPKQRGDI